MVPIVQPFDRVIVISLARRPERLKRFHEQLIDWPFLPPQVFAAIDGTTVPIPAQWSHGPGAWGCMLSHRQALTDALRDSLSSVLILEDDALPITDFQARVNDFLGRVPSDWDCLMLGGQHLCAPLLVTPGVVRCQITNRCHAYALRGRMIPILLNFWLKSETDHCDIILASLMKHLKVYAPSPFLIGQDQGFSDITQTHEPLRFLTAA